jgi:hypothetical protein
VAVVAVMAVTPTTLGLRLLLSPWGPWWRERPRGSGGRAERGRRVDEVEVVTRSGGLVVVVVASPVSPGPATAVEVVSECVENGRCESEQPLRAAVSARATSERARTRLRRGHGTRVIRGL